MDAQTWVNLWSFWFLVLFLVLVLIAVERITDNISSRQIPRLFIFRDGYILSWIIIGAFYVFSTIMFSVLVFTKAHDILSNIIK